MVRGTAKGLLEIEQGAFRIPFAQRQLAQSRPGRQVAGIGFQGAIVPALGKGGIASRASEACKELGRGRVLGSGGLGLLGGVDRLGQMTIPLPAQGRVEKCVGPIGSGGLGGIEALDDEEIAGEGLPATCGIEVGGFRLPFETCPRQGQSQAGHREIRIFLDAGIVQGDGARPILELQEAVRASKIRLAAGCQKDQGPQEWDSKRPDHRTSRNLDTRPD